MMQTRQSYIREFDVREWVIIKQSFPKANEYSKYVTKRTTYNYEASAFRFIADKKLENVVIYYAIYKIVWKNKHVSH